MTETNSNTITGNEISRMDRLTEAILLTLVCAAPWMIGSVLAWGELVLMMGTALAAILSAMANRDFLSKNNFTCLPSLALLGLVFLGQAQSTPFPSRIFAVLDPTAAVLRSELLPDRTEGAGSGALESVALPAMTLSQEPGATRETTGRLFAAWVLLQVVMGLGNGYESLRRFGWVVAVNATILGLFSLIQSLTWNGKIYWIIPLTRENPAASVGGPFVCHTHLAEYLNVGLGFGLGFLLGAAGDRRSGLQSNRALAAYLVGVLVLGIITSNSRGGFLAMLVSAFFTLMCLRSRQFRFWAALGAGLSMVAVFLLVLGDLSPYLERLGTITNSSNEAYKLRPEIWRDALHGWLSHPLFGTGLGTFGTTASIFFVKDIGGYAAHAENEYVELLFTGGCVGFGLGALGLVGVGLRARRARIFAPTGADRVLVLGALAGIVALASQSLSDFGLHVPAISFLMVVLCGHLCRLGGGQLTSTSEKAPTTDFSQLRNRGIRMATAFLLGALFIPGAVQRVRCESAISSIGLPTPDDNSPTPVLQIGSLHELEQRRSTLERALQHRPNWTEGHLRLGLTNLALYVATADEWLTESVPNPLERAEMADPLWLLTLIREGKADTATLQEQEPVRLFLLPAARNFLEARRCCLVSALAHVELGVLSCVFEPNTKPATYVERALLTAGGNTDVIAYAASVALKSGDLPLTARCWKRVLQASDSKWAEVADAAGVALRPELILENVIPENRGRYALMFAERLYTSPIDSATREKFLRVATARLPNDLDLPAPERLWLEGRALSELDERDEARRTMSAALVLEPTRFAWRKELIESLITWGDPEEAHQQALFALHLSPRNPDVRKLVEQTAEAVARGDSSTGTGRDHDRPH